MRYFFTIHGQDRVADDPEGTYLPDEAAALSYAEYTIRELRNEERLQRSGSDDVRKGSSGADGFVIAVFPWLLKSSLLRDEDGSRRTSPSCPKGVAQSLPCGELKTSRGVKQCASKQLRL